MQILNRAVAHEQAGESGGIQAVIHIDPADHPIAGQEAKFYFTFKDPDQLFRQENCSCKVFLFKGQDIIDQKDLIQDTSVIKTSPQYFFTFAEPGDYSIHLSGQPKPGTQFDVFVLHFDFHVFPENATDTASNSRIEQAQNYSGHHSGHSWQDALSVHHLGHGVIFGGGLVAALILLVYGFYEKRKLAKQNSRAIND